MDKQTPKKKGRPGRKAGATTTKKRKRLRTACGCDRLYGFATGCGADDPARLDALIHSASAGDCQFDRRCPDTRQCPVAAQALARSRTLMSAPVRATVPALPAATDSTNWDNVWYY